MVAKRKVVPCILIKMITNSISCLHCLDVSGIFYFVYIVSLPAFSFLLTNALIVDVLSAVLILNIPVGYNNQPLGQIGLDLIALWTLRRKKTSTLKRLITNQNQAQPESIK